MNKITPEILKEFERAQKAYPHIFTEQRKAAFFNSNSPIHANLCSIYKRVIPYWSTIKTLVELEQQRVSILGKKGELTAILRGMSELSDEERPNAGEGANIARETLQEVIAARQEELGREALAAKLATETIDVTLPGVAPVQGHKHPMSIVLDEVIDIFLGMGFSVAEGPHVELTRYVFDALNTLPSHPARDIQDTFYIKDAPIEEHTGLPSVLLRTQTSSVQIRTMEEQSPPLRIISPGRVFRRDEVDATHTPNFTQIEGLVVDKDVTMADLIGTLNTLMKRIYGEETKTRFRPHYFPYTEPSAEVDISCYMCGGKGCSICKQEGWIELLGAGMVHPKVLRECGIDPDIYSGFAFGIGLERLVLGRYQIDDIRLLFDNDMRFLRQFA